MATRKYENDKNMAAWAQYAIRNGFSTASAKTVVALIDAAGNSNWWERGAAMEALSKQTIDPFDIAIKEAALAQTRRVTKSSRQSSFVTGPRGLEGPLSNSIFGGGTSRAG